MMQPKMRDMRIRQISGRAVPVIGDDIDTDRIIPARFLKEITFSKMGEYPFYDERFEADGSKKQHPFNDERFAGARILVGNVNFGCGSSREHAPQSLHRWGIQAIIAESFAEIFAGNCVMLGVPAVSASGEDIATLQKLIQEEPDSEFTLDLERMEVRGGSCCNALRIEVNMPESRRNALVEGSWDSTSLLVANSDKVKETAASLPYMGQKG